LAEIHLQDGESLDVPVRLAHISAERVSLMLAGRRFKLREPVVATTVGNSGERVAVIVPTSSIVEIITGAASGLRVLDVLTDGRVFAMFESDIGERGDELCDQTGEPLHGESRITLGSRPKKYGVPPR